MRSGAGGASAALGSGCAPVPILPVPPRGRSHQKTAWARRRGRKSRRLSQTPAFGIASANRAACSAGENKSLRLKVQTKRIEKQPAFESQKISIEKVSLSERQRAWRRSSAPAHRAGGKENKNFPTL